MIRLPYKESDDSSSLSLGTKQTKGVDMDRQVRYIDVGNMSPGEVEALLKKFKPDTKLPNFWWIPVGVGLFVASLLISIF